MFKRMAYYMSQKVTVNWIFELDVFFWVCISGDNIVDHVVGENFFFWRDIDNI